MWCLWGGCVSDQSIQSGDARQKALNEELERTRGLLTQEIESLRQGYPVAGGYYSLWGEGLCGHLMIM